MSNKTKAFSITILGALSLSLLIACGASKDSGRRAGVKPLPEFGRPEKEVDDKDTLTLKAEELKLTYVTQAWKLNSFSQTEGGEKYLKLQKRFAAPIQFNGWMTLDRIGTRGLGCLEGAGKGPFFTLEDDHGGAMLMPIGEKIPISLEKLYVVRAEYFNDSLCKAVDVQFGILYGTNE